MEIYLLDRGLRKISEKNLASCRNKRLWISISKPASSDTNKLKVMNIHSTTREDLRHQMQRSKLESFENYIYLVVYSVNGSGKKIELDFVLGKNFLITSTYEELPFIDELKNDKAKLTRLLKLGPDFMMHYILDRAIDLYFPYLEKLDDEIDVLEERIFAKKDTNIINALFKLRREVLRLRRTVVPQQQKIGVLTLQKSKFISDGARLYFRDIYDHSARISETVEGFRDLIESTHDTYASLTTQKLNEIIKVLTIMSVTLLPLTLLTGWYGMNFKYLPGLDDPSGYWHPVLAGIGIVGILLFFFKRKGWV